MFGTSKIQKWNDPKTQKDIAMNSTNESSVENGNVQKTKEYWKDGFL